MPSFSDVKRIQKTTRESDIEFEKKPKKKQPKNKKPTSITWEALEYTYHKKSTDWYWILVIMTISLVAIGIYQRNFLFIFLVLLGAFSLGLFAIRQPRTITFILSGEGIQIADRIYPYDSLKSFWLFYHPGDLQELSIESSHLMPYIKLPLGNIDPNKIREFLLDYLPEKAQEESLIDTIARLIKF